MRALVLRLLVYNVNKDEDVVGCIYEGNVRIEYVGSYSLLQKDIIPNDPCLVFILTIGVMTLLLLLMLFLKIKTIYSMYIIEEILLNQAGFYVERTVECKF